MKLEIVHNNATLSWWTPARINAQMYPRYVRGVGDHWPERVATHEFNYRMDCIINEELRKQNVA